MINVLGIVSYKFLPQKMGGQKCIAFFYRFLGQKVTLTAVGTKDNSTETDPGFDVIQLLSTSKLRYLNLFYFFAFQKIIKEKKITHVLIEHPYYGWLGFLLKKFSKIKLVVHSHNIEAIRFKSIGKWWWGILWNYEKWTHRNADINFFITDEDKAFAITHFKLQPGTCHTITYGTEIDHAPLPAQKKEAKLALQELHTIPPAEKVLLFNGTLDYTPNLDAVDTILHTINPLLQAQPHFLYKIIICGKGLPASYNELKEHAAQNIIYAGFVDDISIYFKGADIFINPVIDGGGIKTKLVEALGNDLSVVSTLTGATGISTRLTGHKLITVADTNWQDFTSAILKMDTSATIPAAFFDYFYWERIAVKATETMAS